MIVGLLGFISNRKKNGKIKQTNAIAFSQKYLQRTFTKNIYKAFFERIILKKTF